VTGCEALTGGVGFGHLPRLRKLAASGLGGLTDVVVSSLPGSVEELDVTGCALLTAGVRLVHFAHLLVVHVSEGFLFAERPMLQARGCVMLAK